MAGTGAHSSPAAHLPDAVEAWLAGTVRWRFPAVLQAQFDRDTRRERSRSAGLTSLLGAAVALLMYPVLLAVAPDLRLQATALFLGLAIPFTVAASVAVLLDPPPVAREWLLALPAAVDATVLTYLFARTAANPSELYVAAMVLMLIFICVTVQVRFSVAAANSAYMLGIYAICFTLGHGGGSGYTHALVGMTVVIGAYILLANWRLHANQRRTYVLMLRERLRQRELTARNQVLDELARCDPLTGLANRRAYDVWLEQWWQDAAAFDSPLGLIMIDVDLFKSFNDSHGHPAGDSCLRTIADCLRVELRGISDFVARLGGEEFAVLLPCRPEPHCAALAERLRRAVEGLGLLHAGAGSLGIVTISCGVASRIPGAATTPADLCAEADAALYRAKQAGRNRVRLAGSDLPGAAPALVLSTVEARAA